MKELEIAAVQTLTLDKTTGFSFSSVDQDIDLQRSDFQILTPSEIESVLHLLYNYRSLRNQLNASNAPVTRMEEIYYVQEQFRAPYREEFKVIGEEADAALAALNSQPSCKNRLLRRY